MKTIYLQDLTRTTPDELERILFSINRTAKLTPPAARWLARDLMRPGVRDRIVLNGDRFMTVGD